jgi:hypothetical protein
MQKIIITLAAILILNIANAQKTISSSQTTDSLSEYSLPALAVDNCLKFKEINSNSGFLSLRKRVAPVDTIILIKSIPIAHGGTDSSGPTLYRISWTDTEKNVSGYTEWQFNSVLTAIKFYHLCNKEFPCLYYFIQRNK